MSLAGLGAVAIWHDVVPEANDDFHAWHDREHLPERMGLPGFRRGRRYVALRGTPEYFVLYEADSPETLAGQDYRNRLATPTTWTQRVAPALRNVVRATCRVAFTNGVGSGGVMLTLRFAIDARHHDTTLDGLRRRVLPTLVYREGVAGVHLCLPDPTLDPGAPAAGAPVLPWILLVEGSAVPDVDAAADDVAPALMAHGAPEPARAVYRLEFTRLKTPWAAG